MNKTTHSHPPTIPVFHPKLKKIFKECREWLEHNDRNQQLEKNVMKLESYLSGQGQLSSGAVNPLHSIGHYYSVAACDAAGRNDHGALVHYLPWAVVFNAYYVRFSSALRAKFQDWVLAPSEFWDSMKAAGPCMLSQWPQAEAAANAFIRMAENDQYHRPPLKSRRLKHGTNDAFLVGLFVQAFGIHTRFTPEQALIPEYQGLLGVWRTTDEAEFQAAMQAAAEFHLSRSKGSTGWKFYEFDSAFTQLFPAELLAVQALRRRDGLPAFESGHALIDAPWTLIRNLPEAEPHPLALAVEARLKQDYPQFL